MATTQQADQINIVARAIAKAEHVAVMTGAGASAESNIPTFRDAKAGALPESMQALWEEFDPQTLATPEAFAADPEMVTRWYDWRRVGCLAAKPNPGHIALAAIEQVLAQRDRRFTLLTQNVDGLHQRAGSQNVVELHGSITTWRCTRTHQHVTPSNEPFEQFPMPSPYAEGALLRPNVVWFGEALPEAAIEAAQEAASTCDVFLSVGTSAVVYPAAGFISVAGSNEAFCAEINFDPTPISDQVDVTIRGRSAAALRQIADIL